MRRRRVRANSRSLNLDAQGKYWKGWSMGGTASTKQSSTAPLSPGSAEGQLASRPGLGARWM